MCALSERGVLHKAELEAKSVPVSVPVPTVVQATSLTFEQQKELLALQFEQEKLHRHMEREERLELEKLWQTEKLELERMSRTLRR